MMLRVGHAPQNSLLQGQCHGIVRSFIALCLARFARVKMILPVRALQELQFSFASFQDKPLGNCFFGFEFGHIYE